MRRLLLLFTLCVFFVFEVNAQVSIATFTPGNGVTVAASSSDANVTVGDLSRGAGIAQATGGDFNSNGFDTANATAGDAVTDGDFVFFTITVDNDVTIDFTTLDIRYDRSGTGPDELEIQADVNGNGFNTVFTDNAVDDGSEDNTGIDLSSLSLVQSDVLTIRVVAWGATAGGGTFDIEDTVAFDGSNGLVVRGTITATPPPPPPGVPTLSQWGLIILALSFMTFGTLYILERKVEMDA